MESQRNLLFIALLFVSFMLWQAWVVHQTPQPVHQTTEQIAGVDGATATSGQGKLITVKTDVLSLTINTDGGDIESTDLLAFNETLGSTTPFRLLENTPAFVYLAQSGLVGRDGPDSTANKARPVFTVQQSEFKLTEDSDELRIPMTYVDENTGVTYIKTFVLQRGKYVVEVIYSINNTSDKPLQYEMYGQLKQTIKLPPNRESTGGSFAMQTYRGAAYSTDDTKYKKFSFSDINGENLNVTTQGGWIAMLQQYFATAWVPSGDMPNTFYTRDLPDSGQALIGFRGAPVVVQPSTQQELSAKLWVGPEIQDQMATVAPNLDLTVDYGWLWFLSQPLFKLLQFIHSFVGNWGVSIIIITFIVRGIMYPLTKAQYTSMAKMKLLQPKLQEMRERFGDDRQRMSKEMMELYKKEKVNPLGGCLPLVIQMPIFISLYYMLMGSVELRHAPFIWWLTDLSARDPYFILPLLMGGTMFLIQKMSPTPVTDPMQQKIMTFMPVVFTVFFLWFPSGLVLYYTVSNLVTIVQQKLIYRGLEKRGLHTREKKEKK